MFIVYKKSKRDGRLAFVNIFNKFAEANNCATRVTLKGGWRGKVLEVSAEKAMDFIRKLEPPKKTPYYRNQPWEDNTRTIRSGDPIK